MPETIEADLKKNAPHFLSVLEDMRDASGRSIDDILKPGEADGGADAATEKKEPTEEEKAAAAAKAEADRIAAEKAEADRKAAEAAKTTVIKVVKREPAPAQPVVIPVKVEPTAEEKAKAEADAAQAEFEKTLTDDERDELAIARVAEGMGKKGIVEQYINYYKALSKYTEDNPDQDPDGEEFKKWLEDNRPKWSESDRRKAERKMISDQATADAEAKIEKKYEATDLEVRQIKTQPKIAKATAEIEAALTTENKESKLLPIDKAVVEAIKTEGYAKAVEKFELEAPIVASTVNAAQTWLRLTSGLENINDANQTHNWLLNLVAEEGDNMLRQPKEVQVVNGRQFMPMFQYLKLQRENPAEAAKHFTFSDEMVVDLITQRGLMAYNQKIAALERSGWKREEKKVQTTDQNQNPGATEKNGSSPPSPKGGSRAVPGADSQTVDNKAFLASAPHMVSVLAAMGK